MSKGWPKVGLAIGTGLTSQQLQVDPQEEREQIAKRDQRVQKEQELEISVGSSAELISHPHLWEPVAPMSIQLQRYVNEVCRTELDMLIQRTARLEPPKMLPPRETQMQQRPQGFFQGRVTFRRSQLFSRVPSSHMLSNWGTMRPPPPAHWALIGGVRQPLDWAAKWAAAQTALQGGGGFLLPSGPAFDPLPTNLLLSFC